MAMMTISAVAAAVEQVESRGEWWAQRGCHRGVMQVCTRWTKKPAAQLWIPDINRQEGRRLLTYWHGKSHGDWWTAVAAYRCGWAGLAGKCGKDYASAVLRIARRLDGKGTLDLQVVRPQT